MIYDIFNYPAINEELEKWVAEPSCITWAQIVSNELASTLYDCGIRFTPSEKGF